MILLILLLALMLSVPLSAEADSPALPPKTSPNHRCQTDSKGQPFLLHGDTA